MFASQPHSRIAAGRRAVIGGLVLAIAFQSLAVLSTQNHTVRASSPWRDDPPNVAVTAALFMVPALASVIAARLVVWRAAGAADRARQLVRATGAMLAIILGTCVVQWTAVLVGMGDTRWTGWTTALVALLAVVSVGGVAGALLVLRARTPGEWFPVWKEDWCGDALLICGGVPGLRRFADPRIAAAVRRRSMIVFVACSAVAGALTIAAMAIGEGWTDPALVLWAFLLETTMLLAFCVLSNAVAGFIARAPRGRRQRAAEIAVVSGGLAAQLAEAVRDQVWTAITGHAIGTVGGLIAFTMTAGVLAAVIAWTFVLRAGSTPAAPAAGRARAGGAV